MFGGLLLGSIIGNRNGGLLGGNGDGAGAVAVNNAVELSGITAALGDLKAAVPMSTSQVLLAMAQSADAASTLAMQNTMTLLQGQTALAASVAEVNMNVERSGWAVSKQISEDGMATRALITSNEMAALNRLAAERQDEIIELRSLRARDADTHAININMVQNQTANQQAIAAVNNQVSQLAQIVALTHQAATAASSNVIIGQGNRANNDSTSTNVKG
jgi:hypothetical protein